MKLLLSALIAICFSAVAYSQHTDLPITPAAYRTSVYVPLLKGKRVSVFANHTSVINGVHLVDTLLKLGVNVVTIFSPEHGFRGTADAGAATGNSTDPATNIPIVSLYGNKRKPTANDLLNIDVLVFDIQDVGVRFYTYISSLQYFMEAAGENSKPLLLLDRPNPNSFYIDGPVLDTSFSSFIGMQPVPVVYGMTIGEYAMMIAGEGWLGTEAANKKYAWYKEHGENSADTPFHFLVIKCLNYDHNSRYSLPVKPSPNLPDMNAIYWYPSTCFFEGTNLSEGRGTDAPFQYFGAPSLPKHLFAFTPVAKPGASEPKFANETCYGWNVRHEKADSTQLNLRYLLEAYKLYPNKSSFFLQPKSGDYFFNKLAGNALLMQQLKAGKTEAEIRESWKAGIDSFKQTRAKYLLYN